ncbi:unnamed protein product [Sphagnum jensenii]
MQSGIMVNSSEKNALKKPLEELTDADILQLTREDCRRYLKERGGTQMPSWNKQQAVQQVFSPRHSPDPQGEDEKPAKREYTHVPRHIPSPSLAEWEHTMTSAHPPVCGMGMQQRTAQLTIFYAGVVNVYDDISLEKAQAIMMLAGNANSQFSTHTDAPTSVGSSRPFSAPMSGPQPSPASPAPPTTQTTTTAGVTARKASLARFLEKRKDR